MTTISARPDSYRKRLANDLIWESLTKGGRAEPVAFFCECSGECYRSVWLTPAQYAAIRSNPDGSVLAKGHSTSAAPTRIG